MLDVTLYLITALVWGSTWFAIKLQLGTVPLEWSLDYRLVLSATVMLAFCLLTHRNLKFSKLLHLKFMGVGLTLFSLNYFLVYNSIVHMPSGIAAVIFSLLPLFNIFNSAIFLRQSVDRHILWLTPVGLAGIVVLFWSDFTSYSAKPDELLGLAFALSGVFSASLGNTLASTRDIKNISAIQSTTWSLFYGSAFFTLFTLLKGQPPSYELSPQYIGSLMYLVVFGTVIAFACYFLLIQRVSSVRASYITTAFPLVALTLSTLFENYQWTALNAIGVLIIMCANALVVTSLLKNRSPAASA